MGIQNNLKIRGYRSARVTQPRTSTNLFSFLEIFKARKFGVGFIWG